MSAAPAARTRRGSSARRIDSSAASGTRTARRTSAISSSVAHGCSAYSRPKRSSSASMRVAWATSQRPFTSTRTLPSGPRASRTASTRAISSASDWPRSATLIFAVRQPDPAAISCARAAGTAGTVTLTGTWSRTGAGKPAVAASSALASQRALSRGPYSANGENSPHPAGPWIRAPSRTVMPRNFVVIGIANARNDPRMASTSGGGTSGGGTPGGVAAWAVTAGVRGARDRDHPYPPAALRPRAHLLTRSSRAHRFQQAHPSSRHRSSRI